MFNENNVMIFMILRVQFYPSEENMVTGKIF